MKTTLAERIKSLRRDNGLSQDELARRCGAGQSDISKLENGTVIETTFAVPLALALGVTAEYLITGKGSPNAPRPSPTDADYALVNRVRGVALSAGAGRSLDDHEEVEGHHAFRREWLRSRNLNANHCVVFDVAGDSMSPTLPSGTVVLVNKQDTTVKSGKLYAIAHHGELRVKRITVRFDGSLEIRSDNLAPEFQPPEVIAASQLPSLQLVGRVVWFAADV